MSIVQGVPVTKNFAALNQLERKGWRSTPLNAGWLLEHPDVDGEVYLSVTNQWLSLTCPLKSMRKKGSQDLALPDQIRTYRYLLEQNEQIFMARLGLDDEGTVLLMVEVPMKGSQHLLSWAIDSLIRYASEYMAGGNGVVASQVAIPIGIPEHYPPGETPGIPRETMASYLKGIESNQWRVRSAPQGLGLNWNLGYKSRLRQFDATLTISQNWVYLQVPILMEFVPSVLTSDDIELQALFLNYLLRLNCAWYMAKLGLYTNGYLLLLLELPTETLDFSLFQLATSTVATYLDRYVQEIQIMASLQHDQQLIELLTR